VRLVTLRRPAGESAALAAGFERARGARVVTLDGDLQDDPGEAARLLAELDRGADVAVGWRRERRDPPGKRLGSAAFNALVRALTRTAFRDVNSGLKALARDVALECDLYGERHRLIPVIAALAGRRVVEVPVVHGPRRHGRSKYGAGRWLRGVLDLLTLVFLARFGLRPAHFFGAAGVALGAPGAAILAYIAWLRLATGSIQSRFPLLALGVLLVVIGFQLVTTGFLAELIVAAGRQASGGAAARGGVLALEAPRPGCESGPEPPEPAAPGVVGEAPCGSRS
jgi:dolichol-phosphate mannosyltransferase